MGSSSFRRLGVVLLLLIAGALLALTLSWGDPPAGGDGAAAEDFPDCRTAEELLARIDALARGPDVAALPPRSGAEAKAMTVAHLRRLAAASAEFSRRYPRDPRRWEQKLLGLQIDELLSHADPAGPHLSNEEKEWVLREIAYGEDASAEVRADALFTLIAMIPARMQHEGEAAVLAETAGEIALFEHAFPDDPRRDVVRLDRAALEERRDLAKARALYQELAGSPVESVARTAQERLGKLGPQ